MVQKPYIAIYTLLLTALLLLAGPRYVLAQNSPNSPYINSTQLYRVPMGDVNNRVEWQLSNPNATPPTRQLGNTLSYIDSGRINNIAPTLDSALIKIKFIEAVFSNAGTPVEGPWNLIYSEYDRSSNCVARRIVTFTPVANQFNLHVNTFAPDCNSFTGTIWTNNDTLTKADTMVVDLAVLMSKADNHLVREWSFNAEVTLSAEFGIPASSTVFIPTAFRNGTSTSNGSYTISAVSGGAFTLTVNNLDPSSPLYGENGDRVDFQVQIIGAPVYDAYITLTISNGIGVSGTNFRIVTDENSNTDNEATRLLFGIPNTSIVSAVP